MSRTTEWRRKRGIGHPRVPLPPPDISWMHAHIDAIQEGADHGARQARNFARSQWGQEGLEMDELRAVGALAICERSGLPGRDSAAWLTVVARNGCLSHIKQHVIGAQKRKAAPGDAPDGDASDDESVGAENARAITAVLRASHPEVFDRHWRQHPEQIGAKLREVMQDGTVGNAKVHSVWARV